MVFLSSAPPNDLSQIIRLNPANCEVFESRFTDLKRSKSRFLMPFVMRLIKTFDTGESISEFTLLCRENSW